MCDGAAVGLLSITIEQQLKILQEISTFLAANSSML